MNEKSLSCSNSSSEKTLIDRYTFVLVKKEQAVPIMSILDFTGNFEVITNKSTSEPELPSPLAHEPNRITRLIFPHIFLVSVMHMNK